MTTPAEHLLSDFKKEPEIPTSSETNPFGEVTGSHSISKNRSTTSDTFSRCDHRGTEFQVNSGHKSHVKTESAQQQVSLWNCAVCSASFPTWMDLNLHKSIHSNSFTCQNCCKSFSRDRDLKVHRRKCWTEWICGHCNQVFDRHAFLRKHMKRKHGKEFKY
ncbi:unnamed protein product [Allacma fusca]|uniref:C2H2-type domain-containing protein n=1 Tax=Allacma fusca TaxID=39272 RepID=A0A8J2KUR6_9HEXA|nr:unnamed protein product [Allacma fusca]